MRFVNREYLARCWTEFDGRVSLLLCVAKLQLHHTRSNIEDCMPVITMPLYSLVSISVLTHAERVDLVGYAMTAAMLMTMIQMALFVSGDILTSDKNQALLELYATAPSSYSAVVMVRVSALTLFSLIGFAESYLIARVLFGIDVVIFQPGLFLLVSLLTAAASIGHGMIITALLGLVRSPRTYQNILSGPFYLLGGVLVPTTFLPIWLSTLSPGLYLYWSANLMRTCFESLPGTGQTTALSVLSLISVFSIWLGLRLLNNMIARLRVRGDFEI